jgi:hypothetical protein
MTIHWTKLKKMVEDAGGTWTTREEAEAFLASAGVVVADEPEVVFDPAKEYSEVFGGAARYCQGGHYFNTKGEKVG